MMAERIVRMPMVRDSGSTMLLLTLFLYRRAKDVKPVDSASTRLV